MRMSNTDVITLVGFIAGTLTTVAYVPQVVRSWRLKETRDISLSMLVLYAIGVFLWLVYGCWTNSLPIIVANGISEILILILLGIKLHYR
jgi:MtN3 and saliva related transmembrane protein